MSANSTARMYGLTRDELLGEMAVTVWSAEAYQDRNSDFHQYYQHFVRSGYVLIIMLKCRSEQRTEEIYGCLSASRESFKMGAWCGSGVSQIDITERKQAQDALRQSEAKYRTLVEQANDGVIVIQDEQIKFANTRFAKMTGVHF